MPDLPPIPPSNNVDMMLMVQQDVSTPIGPSSVVQCKSTDLIADLFCTTEEETLYWHVCEGKSSVGWTCTLDARGCKVFVRDIVLT